MKRKDYDYYIVRPPQTEIPANYIVLFSKATPLQVGDPGQLHRPHEQGNPSPSSPGRRCRPTTWNEYVIWCIRSIELLFTCGSSRGLRVHIHDSLLIWSLWFIMIWCICYIKGLFTCGSIWGIRVHIHDSQLIWSLWIEPCLSDARFRILH